MADSEKKDDVGGTGKSPGGSKLDSLSREDLLKFVKKQMVLLQKSRTKCDEVTKKLAEVESNNTVEKKNNLDKIQTLQEQCNNIKQEKELICQKFVQFEKKNKELLEEIECLQMKDKTLTSTLHCMQDEQQTFSQTNRKLEDEVKSLITERDSLAEQVHSASSKQGETIRLSEEFDIERREYERKIELLTQQIQELDRSHILESESTSKTLEAKTVLESENTCLHEKLQNMEAEIQRFQECMEQKEFKMSKLSQNEVIVQELSKQLQTVAADLKNNQDQLQSAIEEISQIKSEKSDLVEKLQHSEFEMKSYENIFAEKNQTITELTEKFESLKQDLESMEEKYETVLEEKSEILTQNLNLQEKFHDMDLKLQEWQKKIEEKDGNISELLKQIENFKRLHESDSTKLNRDNLEEIETVNLEIKELQEQCQNWETECSQHSEMKIMLVKQLDQLARDLSESKAETSRLNLQFQELLIATKKQEDRIYELDTQRSMLELKTQEISEDIEQRQVTELNMQSNILDLKTMGVDILNKIDNNLDVASMYTQTEIPTENTEMQIESPSRNTESQVDMPCQNTHTQTNSVDMQQYVQDDDKQLTSVIEISTQSEVESSGENKSVNLNDNVSPDDKNYEAEVHELLAEREEMEQDLVATKQKLGEWDDFMQMLKDEKEQLAQEVEEADIREEKCKKEMEFMMLSLQEALSERDSLKDEVFKMQDGESSVVDEMKMTVKDIIDDRNRLQVELDASYMNKGDHSVKLEGYRREMEKATEEKEAIEREKDSLFVINDLAVEKEKQLVQQIEDMQFQFEEADAKTSCLDKEVQDAKCEIEKKEIDILDLSSKLDNMEKLVTDAAAGVKERQVYVIEMESQILELSNSLTNSKKKYADIKEQLDLANSDNADTLEYCSKIQELQKLNTELSHQVKGLELSNCQLETEKSEVEIDCEKLMAEIQKLSDAKHASDTEFEANIQIVDMMKEHLSALTNQVDGYEQEKSQIEGIEKLRTQQLLAVEEALKIVQGENEIFQEEKNEIVNKLIERNKEFYDLEGKLQTLLNERPENDVLKKLQDNIKTLSEEKEELEIKHVCMREESSKLIQKLEELKNNSEEHKSQMIEEKESILCESLNAVSAKDTHIEQLNETLSKASEELTSKLQLVEEEKKKFIDQYSQLEKELHILKADKENYILKYELLKQDAESLEHDVTGLKFNLEKLTLEKEETLKNLKIKESQFEDLVQRLSNKDQILKEMASSADEHQTILMQKLEEESSKLQEKLNLAEISITDHEYKCNMKDLELQKLQNQFPLLQKIVLDLEEIHQVDTNKIKDLQDMVIKLEESLQNLKQEKQELLVQLNDTCSKAEEQTQKSLDSKVLQSDELTKMRSTLKDKEGICVKLKQLAIKSKKDATDTKAKLASVTQEMCDLVKGKDELEQEVLTFKNQISENSQNLLKMQQKMDQSEKDMVQMVDQLTDARHQLAESGIAEKELSLYLENKNKSLEDSMNKVKDATTENLALKIQLQEIKKEKQQIANMLNEEKADNEKKLAIMETDIKELTESLHSAKKNASQSNMMDLEIADYERTVETLNSKTEEKESKIVELKNEIERLEERIKTFQEQIESVEEQRVQAEDRGNKLKQLLVKTKKELADAKKLESEQRSSDAQLRGQMEYVIQVAENQKIQMAELAGENQRLQEKLRTISDGNQRTVRSLESKAHASQDDLDIARSELTAIQAEFDSYKVRAHSVLKQQKSKPSPDINSDIEKEERSRLEKAVEQLKTKLQESSDKMASLQQDSEILQEEYERLLQRHNKLLADMEDSEDHYRKRLEIVSSEKSKSIIEQQDAIKQLTYQNETIVKSFKEQLKSMQEDHIQALTLLQKQCDSLDMDNIRLRRELQQTPSQRLSRSVDNTDQRESPHEFFMDAHGEERQEGEGSEIVEDNMCQKNSIHATHVGLSFEQLLTTPIEDQDEKIIEQEDTAALQNAISTAHKKIEHLSEVLNESEASVMRLTEQANILKDEIRRLERNQEREQETKNLEYLKNIFIKFLTPKVGERHQLIPVLTQMLKLSTDEKNILLSIAGDESEPVQRTGWGSYLHRWSGMS